MQKQSKSEISSKYPSLAMRRMLGVCAICESVESDMCVAVLI